MKSTTTLQSNFNDYTNNTNTDNSARGLQWINDSLRYLSTVYYFNETTYTTTTVASQQEYTLPYDIEKVINVTVTVGSTVWQPKEAPSRQFWDALNVVPFTQDIPQYYYIYNGKLLIWGTPASDGNTITIHYKRRLRDLSVADLTGQNVTVANGSATVTGTATSWYTDMAGRWIRIAPTSSNTTSGDNQWYQILSVGSATSLTLYNAYTGTGVTNGTAVIGEMPILPEDFHDIPVYRACYIYFTSIVSNPEKAAMFKGMYDEGAQLLEERFGSRTYNVALNDLNAPVYNPNLFPRSIG